MNPIEPKRISKSTNSLTKSSLVKAGLVFLGTVGVYYLAKATNIFSYFRMGSKNSNSKDVNSEIMKVKTAENALSLKMSLETARQVNNNPSVNRIARTYKGEDKTVKFEEMKVEDFKNLLEVEKEENVRMQKSSSRRFISVQNSLPDQNITVREPFELIINGTSIFNSSSALFLEVTNIPTWLRSHRRNPTFKGSYDTPGRARGIALSGNYAYVADSSSGLQIIDISDPSNPTLKGSYDTPGSAQKVALSGNYAYVADGGSGLQIIDVTNPANLTFKGSYDTPKYALEVALSGNYAYVADNNGGLQIIDISDPSNPIFGSSWDTPDYALGVAVSGNYAYVAAGDSLQIIDIRYSPNSIFKGSYDMPRVARGVALSGNYAYVANYNMYVADYSSGLHIIDIRDPSNPTFKGSCDTPGFATGVTISGNYAYVTDKSSSLQIVDITDLAKPILKSSYDTPGSAYDVALSENYVYVAADRSGLQIISLKSDKLTLSGRPRSTGIYGVDIKACNEEKECAINSFNIIVNGSDYVTDVGDITNLISAEAIIVIVSVLCAPLIVGVLLVVPCYVFLKNPKSSLLNETSKKESFTNTEELQDMEFTDDGKNIVDNELPRPLDEQKISQEVKREEELVYYPD
jgi:hypothetical protein